MDTTALRAFAGTMPDAATAIIASLDELNYERMRANLLAEGLTISDAKVAELTRLLDECQGDTDPPPAYTMPVGATVGRRGTETQAQAVARFERETGPLGIRRAFTGQSVSQQALASMLAIDAGKRHRHYSFKGNGARALTPAMIAQIPDDGFETDLTVWHEAENDGGTHTPAWFKSEQARWSDVIWSAGRPDVHANVVYMTWLERDPSSTTSTRLWLPDGDLTRWKMSLDPYDDLSKATLASLVHATVQLWLDDGGLLSNVGIAETGTKRTGANGGTWVTQSIDYALSQTFRHWCYFDSPEGDKGPWWLDDPAMRTAYRLAAPVAGD